MPKLIFYGMIKIELSLEMTVDNLNRSVIFVDFNSEAS